VEQQKQVDEETERLNRLKALMHLIDKEGRMTNDVIMKEVEPQWIVSLREHIPAYRVVGQLIGKLYGLLGPLGGQGMGVVLLHDPEYKEQNVDVEAGVYLKQPTEVQSPLHCYQLPAVTVASVQTSVWSVNGSNQLSSCSSRKTGWSQWVDATPS
jgi:hypothetical protein